MMHPHIIKYMDTTEGPSEVGGSNAMMAFIGVVVHTQRRIYRWAFNQL